MIGARKLLWVDCIAAAMAGVLMLSLSGWLSRLYALPRSLLLVVAGVNLMYGAYSFSLARQARRKPALIKLLVFGNATWSVVCLGLAALFWREASSFGLAQLVGEAIFVGALAAMEWMQRHELASPSGSRLS